MHLLIILLATLTISLPAALAQRIFPAPISLHNFTYGGSGCPADSAISSFDPSLPSLQFKATRHDVRLGKDISAGQNRKNCQIRAEILVPSNYSITISRRHVQGTAILEEGVSAQFPATVYLTGEGGMVTPSNSFHATVKGPWDATFNKSDEIEYESPWTPCEGGVAVFNFNTQVKLTLQNAAPINATGAVEPIVEQQYEFMWYKC